MCAGKAALDRERELAVVQVDFSAAVDHVSLSYLSLNLRDQFEYTTLWLMLSAVRM